MGNDNIRNKALRMRKDAEEMLGRDNLEPEEKAKLQYTLNVIKMFSSEYYLDIDD